MLQKTNIQGHKYVCLVVETGEIIECEKLPPILKRLREETNYTFKIPHGNKVRTLILENGRCLIHEMKNDKVKFLYEITIERW